MNNVYSFIKDEDEPNDNNLPRTFLAINKKMLTIKGEDESNDNNNLDLTQISEFTDEDKEEFILSSIDKFITNNFLILIIIIIIAIFYHTFG